MIRRTRMAFAIGIAIAGGAAQAQVGNDWFNIRGFGTAAIIKNTSDNTFYRTSPVQPSGARNGWDGGSLNRLGVQANVTPLPWFEGTLQMISQRRYDDSYNPEVEWAFFKLKPTSDISIRFGRMVLPAFMVSDTRNVGYAHTMTTPPVDVYTQVLPRKFDGVDVNWRFNAGDVTVNLTPFAGRRREPVGGGTVITLDKMRGLNTTAEWNSWTFRAGYVNAKISSANEAGTRLWKCMQGESNELNAACTGYAAAVPMAGEVARDLNVQRKDVSFAGIGLQYDDGNVIAAAELTERKQENYFPDTRAWYVMGGYRIKEFTPYLSVSQLKNTSPTDDSRLVGLSAGAYAGFNSVIATNVNNVLRAVANEQRTLTAGLRWDVYKDTAIKLQYDRVKIKNNFGFAYKQAGGSSGSSPLMHVYSATVDFVF